jgi:hypothetical protein
MVFGNMLHPEGAGKVPAQTGKQIVGAVKTIVIDWTEGIFEFGKLVCPTEQEFTFQGVVVE